MTAQALTIKCPSCGSERVVCNGHRFHGDVAVQRYNCKNCRSRFSEPNNLNVSQTIGGSSQQNNRKRLELAALEKDKTSAGTTGTQTQEGLIVEFAWKMKKRNKANNTIKNRITYLNKLIRLGADLQKPETVETILATEEMTVAAKFNMVKTYLAFTKAYKIEWEPIDVNYQPKEAFDPHEEEIDQLINACSKATKTFLQVAKDTGARVGEIRKIQWTDIDEKNNTIAINHPEKGSRPRTVKVTEKTIAWIKNLKKNHGSYLFNPTFVSQRATFAKTRQKMAELTNNPRLLQIHFHTFRHWRASREYERAGDIYDVKKLLGHKALSSTDRYQHGSYSNAEYVIKRPKTPQEEDVLLTAGFEFVRYDHKADTPVYRKRK